MPFYVVATPIGNLDDITYRAVNILKEADVIYCENEKNSSRLLNHYDIHTPLKRLFHSFSEKEFGIIAEKIRQGKNIALISDAGTPGISDPGSSLIRYLRENSIEVIPVPGASALSAILSVSGWQSNPSVFLGFLPEKKGKKRTLLESLSDFEGLIIFYESVHKIRKTIETLSELFADSELLIGRELTKKHEEILHFSQISPEIAEKIVERGEFVVIINNFIKKISKENRKHPDMINKR